jgi:hypothetical protein
MHHLSTPMGSCYLLLTEVISYCYFYCFSFATLDVQCVALHKLHGRYTPEPRSSRSQALFNTSHYIVTPQQLEFVCTLNYWSGRLFLVPPLPLPSTTPRATRVILVPVPNRAHTLLCSLEVSASHDTAWRSYSWVKAASDYDLCIYTRILHGKILSGPYFVAS